MSRQQVIHYWLKPTDIYGNGFIFPEHFTACGVYLKDELRQLNPNYLTRTPSEITCKNCLKRKIIKRILEGGK